VLKDIAAVKAMVPKVINEVRAAWHSEHAASVAHAPLRGGLTRAVCSQVCVHAMRIHGGLGVSWELPLLNYVMAGHIRGIADGPTEVHKARTAIA
jgi:alkylation response protein AidB-like acyl-CoA dehydrogenase